MSLDRRFLISSSVFSSVASVSWSSILHFLFGFLYSWQCLWVVYSWFPLLFSLVLRVSLGRRSWFPLRLYLVLPLFLDSRFLISSSVFYSIASISESSILRFSLVLPVSLDRRFLISSSVSITFICIYIKYPVIILVRMQIYTRNNFRSIMSQLNLYILNVVNCCCWLFVVIMLCLCPALPASLENPLLIGTSCWWSFMKVALSTITSSILNCPFSIF